VKFQLPEIFASRLWLSATIGLVLFTTGPLAAETLKGGVKEKNGNPDSGSRLQRNDANQGADPFSSGGQKPDVGSQQQTPDAFDTPGNSAAVPKAFMTDPDGEPQNNGNRPSSNPNNNRTAPPRNNRGNNTIPNHGGSGAAPVVRSGTVPESRSAAPIEFRSATANSDPDKSTEMQVLWDAWHARVAQTIYQRFDHLAQVRFKRGKVLECKVSYLVTSDQKIENVHVLQHSTDPAFDQLIVTTIQGMTHHPYLLFPRQSQRQSVERTGTFTLNKPNNRGFEYQKGDKEQIRN
jgi:outer membrane biosynthesis protein TonB